MGFVADVNSFQMALDKSNDHPSILPPLDLSQGTHNHCLENIFLEDHGSYLHKPIGIVTLANVRMDCADLWLFERTWGYFT